ncbi:hypothetical protein [Rhizobium bangladeshense]|uniref:hypothetical protein n=1 Tax=Rhizobium bangladeshense TaxID=1138189 RepID=UPI001428AE0A
MLGVTADGVVCNATLAAVQTTGTGITSWTSSATTCWLSSRLRRGRHSARAGRPALLPFALRLRHGPPAR